MYDGCSGLKRKRTLKWWNASGWCFHRFVILNARCHQSFMQSGDSWERRWFPTATNQWLRRTTSLMYLPLFKFKWHNWEQRRGKKEKKTESPRHIKYFYHLCLKKKKWKQLESSDSFTAWPILQTPTILLRVWTIQGWFNPNLETGKKLLGRLH